MTNEVFNRDIPLKRCEYGNDLDTTLNQRQSGEGIHIRWSDLCNVCNPGAPVIFVIDIHNVKKHTHVLFIRSPYIALIFRLHENCTYSVYISILSSIHFWRKKKKKNIFNREWKFIITIKRVVELFEKSLTIFSIPPFLFRDDEP